MVLILLWVTQIYYNICRGIIVWNIAYFSDNVTYNNANYSDKTDNKNAHTYQYSPIEVSQQGKWNHSRSAIMWCYVWCVVCFFVWVSISYWCVKCSDIFWTPDDDNGRTYAFFEQDSATFDYNCMRPFHNVFGDSSKQRIVASSFIILEPM